ncbi:hypothetical protein RNZ50_17895 [Paracoccaceae bacterium Fryx2]|nr:hypothetical protein [Paracoccaceae bacterium Fryx2]
MTAADWGYGWAFPKRGGLTLGVGGVHRRNPDLRARLDMLLARHGIDPGACRIKGAFLPFGDPRPAPGRGAVLLAGDAAGMVDPLTGEGIAWAMRSGQLAALAAAEALAAGRPHTAFAAYAHALRPLQRELARARLARSLVYHPLLQRRGLDLIARQPGMQRRHMQLLAGEMYYADIPSRLPKLALALMR